MLWVCIVPVDAQGVRPSKRVVEADTLEAAAIEAVKNNASSIFQRPPNRPIKVYAVAEEATGSFKVATGYRVEQVDA